jgi:hypothetical protein
MDFAAVQTLFDRPLSHASIPGAIGRYFKIGTNYAPGFCQNAGDAGAMRHRFWLPPLPAFCVRSMG